MFRSTGVWAAVAAVAVASSAMAFGTVGKMGQNFEHERITRHALGCKAGGLPQRLCFESDSLDEIAGKPPTWRGIFWGAVGAPDNPARLLMTSSIAHCDNGDFVDSPGYPNTREKAQGQLIACRAEMDRNLNRAVEDAAALLDDRGRIKNSEIPTIISCTYVKVRGPTARAKCNVLEDLGLVLHAAQDFYSHSNWVDHQSIAALSLENPRGLNNTGRAEWLNLRRDQPFPDGLITGCFDILSNVSTDAGCPGHVKHYYLNKDKGQIDPTIGKGSTPRGQIDDNFKKAVEAAIEDSKDKFYTFKERLEAKYGPAKAALLVCAITHDNPVKTCRAS